MERITRVAKTFGRGFAQVASRRKSSAVAPFDSLLPAFEQETGHAHCQPSQLLAPDPFVKGVQEPEGCRHSPDSDSVDMMAVTTTTSLHLHETSERAAFMGGDAGEVGDYDEGSGLRSGDAPVVFSDADSLTVSEWSDEALDYASHPPLMPGGLRPRQRGSVYDGQWVLCSRETCSQKHIASWLETLTICGNLVVDGNGKLCTLSQTSRGPVLFGGRLKRKGAALVRVGKTGGVLVYLRRCD